MKKTLFLCCISIFLYACQSGEGFVPGSAVTDKGELLLKNFPYLANASSFKKNGLPMNSCTGPTTREELDNYKTVIKIYNGKDQAGVSVPGFGGLKLEKEEISYNVYYVEPKIVVCNNIEKVYGVGYSYHLLIKKLKKGLSIDKLPYIAANVQLESGKTQVYYSLQSYGITGIPIVKFFKPVVNKPYDVEGFNIMQSSIDGVHGFLGDSTLSKQLTFRPQELSFIKPEDLR
ncbi:hypothetical protein SNE26_24635 [Mucilaginibacter sp. cycad4]|uniref:hypothetical protein n=1 Tax=Mucilaginibacter sp. cycad4 TaxID=3342096 RepID=UPI002AABB7F0|nr:hypothetical protein [Mucilaginibacter gossypii]WPU99204.1 hypothetical protein SNE26_24635 [Mucilaginibacter gossypii]